MTTHLILIALTNLILGVSLGAAGGLLGIGGGIIAIPILGYLYGMDQHLAQGTALVMIAPNVLIGFYRYHQQNRIDLRSVAAMSIFSMAATYFSAKFVAHVDSRHLQMAFAFFLIALALYFGSELIARALRKTPRPAQAANPPRAISRGSLPLLGVASGAMSGIFTVGGGLVVVPVLVKYFGMTQTRAQGMALALVVPGAFIALGTYANAGHVSWLTGIPMALGGMLSISWGVKLAHKFSPVRLRLLFCVVMLATALMMLLFK